jgi:hypothetical protein
VVCVCVICVVCHERSYHVNCTRSRPIPEVKLRRVQPVVRCVSTCEAWILFVLICSSLRLRYCKQHTSYAIILENNSMLIWVRSQKSEVRSQKSEVRSQTAAARGYINGEGADLEFWPPKIFSHASHSKSNYHHYFYYSNWHWIHSLGCIYQTVDCTWNLAGKSERGQLIFELQALSNCLPASFLIFSPPEKHVWVTLHLDCEMKSVRFMHVVRRMRFSLEPSFDRFNRQIDFLVNSFELFIDT